MNEFNYDIINDYVCGELNGEALLAFEKELQTNESLAKEVAIFKTIQDELGSQFKNKSESENLKQTLGKLNETYFEKPKAKVVSMKKIIIGIIAVAAAVLLFFMLKPSNNNYDKAAIYASAIKDVEPISNTVRGIGIDDDIEKAKLLYNAKNYTEALPKLKAIVEKKKEETELTMALGVCYLKTNKLDSAFTVFDSIAQGITVYKYNAILYKALIYFKQNNTVACKALLKLIPEDADKYKAAQALLKKIK